MGHPEVGSERVRRLLCRDLQRRQQAQTLHGHRHDWLPRAGLAGEGAGAFPLLSGTKNLHVVVFSRGLVSS